MCASHRGANLHKPAPLSQRNPQTCCQQRVPRKIFAAALTSPTLASMSILSRLGLLCLPVALCAAELPPPGQRPEPPGVHALVGARVVIKPGAAPANVTILIRAGRIADLLAEGQPLPADARVWNMTGKTIYAGFIDPYLAQGTTNRPISNRWTVPIEATAGIAFHGGPNTKADMGAPGPGYEVARITPAFRVAEKYSPREKELKELRELGFTAANIIPTQGIIRGTSAFVLLTEEDPNRVILKADVFQHVAFETPGEREDGYPNSLMGVIASVRQAFFDARHQVAARTYFSENPTSARPEYNPALEALRPALGPKPVLPTVFEPGSALMNHRAKLLADELGLQPVLVASGQEWRRPELAKATGAPFIVPLALPAIPEFPEEDDWQQVSLDELRTWDWAPEIPALLRRQNLIVALTTYALPDRKSFRPNLRRAMERGFTEEDALAALTTIPATLCGLDAQLGTIAKGKLANLTIVDGKSYFEAGSKVAGVWIEGRPYLSTEAAVAPDKAAPKPEPSLPRTADVPAAYRGPLAEPASVLIRNATVWTSGPQGTIEKADVLIRNGRIEAVGKSPLPVRGAVALEINGTGMHLTPGIIDCHSHSMILGGVNEGTLPSTAMVRIGDVVNSETDNIFNQLAGGLTTANLLHGSANPIGGQNAVIKLRYGAAPEDMKFSEAPAGIKFALGENVKQSNWGEKYTTRFPQTRMGVRTFFANRFTAALQYRQAQTAGGAPVRRNLELEAIAEIIEGKRLVHCHSYRQDEILSFLRTMEQFGVKVATLQHVLEGYKVADEIAAHGAGASAFSDWWAYKFEVIDAIPYAGALMHDRGAVVSFNSDSSDLARRLNLEAAKAVKYGGVPEADALRFVTLNPAKQLRIDKWVGSIEPGKHADIVLWSASPLSTQSVCEQTWIDGKLYYDRQRAVERLTRLQAERARLLAKAKKPQPATGDKPAEKARAAFFQRALETAHQTSRCYECRKDN